jgi:hypothetical protein
MKCRLKVAIPTCMAEADVRRRGLTDEALTERLVVCACASVGRLCCRDLADEVLTVCQSCQFAQDRGLSHTVS